MWYKVTPTFGSAYRASTCNENTDFDTKILVFEGSDCNSLTCVTHNDDLEDCGTKSGVSWPAETGKEYYILVHGFWAVNKRGSFGLSIEEFTTPENDECEFATLVTPSESVAISGSTSNAMVDKSTPSCFLPVVSPGVCLINVCFRLIKDSFSPWWANKLTLYLPYMVHISFNFINFILHNIT